MRKGVPVYDLAANMPMTTAIETRVARPRIKNFNEAGRFFKEGSVGWHRAHAGQRTYFGAAYD